jgi:histidyl-tRNA synthetase
MNFLSEKSRVHFRQMLEHLERLGLPYELDDMLVGDERDPRIVFAIDLAEEDATIVSGQGGRYDDYVRRLTGRKDGAVASASIFFRKRGLLPGHLAMTPSRRAPKIYFVQLGLPAKLMGLGVLDSLRRAKLPVLQSFDTSHLSHQLEAAKAKGITHLLIMGQREVLDGTVILRKVATSSQTIVALRDLPRVLKTLH